MPKKDTATAVLGMLSTVGAQTRSAAPSESTPAGPTGDLRAPGSLSALAPTPPESASTSAAVETAPRTLRLRAETAQRLRAAWLEAKRDDVLLTAQDFASSLVEDALTARRRRSRTAASS